MLIAFCKQLRVAIMHQFEDGRPLGGEHHAHAEVLQRDHDPKYQPGGGEPARIESSNPSAVVTSTPAW